MTATAHPAPARRILSDALPVSEAEADAWSTGDLDALFRVANRAEEEARVAHAKAEADGRRTFARTGVVSLQASRAEAEARSALVVAQARALKARMRLMAIGGQP